MSSIKHTRPVLQFRFRVKDGNSWYEQIIPVDGGANNYQPAEPMVVQTAWNDFYRKPEGSICESLIAGSPTEEASVCMSFGGSETLGGLSTLYPVTNMESASALWKCSSATFGK